MSLDDDDNSVWIYHERQQALLCGQHALNNLIQQGSVFTPTDLADAAHALDEQELRHFRIGSAEYKQRLQEGSHHVNAAGNFSIEVLRAALTVRYGVSLTHVNAEHDWAGDITTIPGFLCHKQDHWFAIRSIGGRFWNLNSVLERPEPISHFQLATCVETWQQKEGYTIFMVMETAGSLPKPVGKKVGTGKCWHLMSALLEGKSDTTQSAWEGVGSGVRLDGKSTTAAAATSSSSSSMAVVEGLTEEEQLQLALQASMEATPSRPPRQVSLTSLPDEPSADMPHVRIQFRILNSNKQKRTVRRFALTDPVDAVWAFCQQSAGGHHQIEAKFGYPPKSLDTVENLSVLANESVQVRIV